MAVIETPEQAIASQRAAKESLEHDSRDLDAQIRAADAAENQIFPSWLGAILSFIGTCLIVWTLFETRNANEIARNAARADRAWICVEDLSTVFLINAVINDERGADLGKPPEVIRIKHGYGFQVVFKNMGRTPAVRVRTSVDMRVHERGKLPEYFEAPHHEDFDGKAMVGPDKIFLSQMPHLDDAQSEGFRKGVLAVTLKARVTYQHIYAGPDETPRETIAEYLITHSGGTTERDGKPMEVINIQITGDGAKAT